jgi:hypothetical protein
MKLDPDIWTYGAEHEFSDWDCLAFDLPRGFKRAPDYTIVNSNGIAAQLDTSVYRYGGEINTPPTSTIRGQLDCLALIKKLHPQSTVNHRSNLHIHIRVPDLKNSLSDLKKLQFYIHQELRPLICSLEPIPRGKTLAERKREKRRYTSHHHFLPVTRLNYQLRANTIEDFFYREVPSKNSSPLWHLEARLCVNLRQMLETDTIEFRHFPGTISEDELSICFEWCRDFLIAAFTDKPLKLTYLQYSERLFPKFPIFNLDREIGYQATNAHGEFELSEIKENIWAIENGRFYETRAYKKAYALACGLSW